MGQQPSPSSDEWTEAESNVGNNAPSGHVDAPQMATTEVAPAALETLVADELAGDSSPNLETILAHVESLAPPILIVDSIQAVRCRDVASVPGSIAQVRESATRFVDCSKAQALGWRCERDFPDALERTVAWYRDNRSWWEPLKAGA